MMEQMENLPEEEKEVVLQLPNSYFERGLEKGKQEGKQEEKQEIETRNSFRIDSNRNVDHPNSRDYKIKQRRN